jgi:hypothetical protein
MTKETRAWVDGEWICLFVNDGVSQATVSLTASEASSLARELLRETEEACPVCGNEERGQGGYLSCECPAPKTTGDAA